jgi:hypothetical protein
MSPQNARSAGVDGRMIDPHGHVGKPEFIHERAILIV